MEADSINRPKLSSPYVLPVFNVDLTGDGKLGYGFTSVDELEETYIGPWVSYDQHASARADIFNGLEDSARGAPYME